MTNRTCTHRNDHRKSIYDCEIHFCQFSGVKTKMSCPNHLNVSIHFMHVIYSSNSFFINIEVLNKELKYDVYLDYL